MLRTYIMHIVVIYNKIRGRKKEIGKSHKHTLMKNKNDPFLKKKTKKKTLI